MRPTQPLSLAALVLSLLLLGGCGSSGGECSPSSCTGCCAAGVCQSGFSPQACGARGGSCSACNLNDLCQVGTCVPYSGGGGGGGGGGTCQPKSCIELGKNCGSVADGCGGTLACGNCDVASESCGGSGVPNVCGPGACAPKTCIQLGKNCGAVSDGCSSQLDCGLCQSPATCGGGGVENVCGQGCVPTTCSGLGKNCGQVPDGCGQVLSCGSCAAPQSCGGSGTPNVCGQGCVPKTCAGLGKNCGIVADGCGSNLSCGSCTAPQSCGGAGTPNVCGAICASTCPQGYSCNSFGTCTGGNPASLVLNVPVPPLHLVSGKVTLNGADPVAASCTTATYYSRATVKFEHATDSRFDQTLYVGTCANTTDPFTFSGQLYPGTYKVTVAKYTGSYALGSNLPGWSTVSSTSFTVSGPMSNVVFNVPVPPLHTVSGKVTLNGADPVAASCTTATYYSRATVAFEHVTDSRFNQTLYVGTCANTTDPFTFSGQLYPGTYKVTVA
ncbi:MAG: hypothetical protein ACYC8T_31610, partial [Myxococcaceae bacterium]